MTSPVFQQIRERISAFMVDRLPVPKKAGGKTSRIDEEEAETFYREWCVRGDWEHGLFADYSDSEDMIEFGLLERIYGDAVNVLHVSIAELNDEDVDLDCISAVNDDMNFDAIITSEKQEPLGRVLRVFDAWLSGDDLD